MRSVLGGVGLVGVVALSVAVPIATPANAVVTSATIHGTVDGVSGPLQDVLVSAVTATSGGTTGGSAYTDASGGYSFTVTPAGDYYIAFNGSLAVPGGPGYSTLWFTSTGGSLDVDQAAAVSLAEGSSVEEDVTIPGDGTLTGTVTDATTDQPISSVDVQALGVSSKAFLGSTFTAADGTYTLTHVPPVAVKIWFESNDNKHFIYQYYGGGLLASEGTSVTATTNATTGNINGSLLALAHVAGQVGQAGGGAPHPVTASALDSTGNVVGVATTNSAYDYTVPVPAGVPLLVKFASSSGSTYATQYFDNRPSLSCADKITLSDLGTKIIDPVMTTSAAKLTPCGSGGTGPSAAQIKTSLGKQLVPTGKKAAISRVLSNGGYRYAFTALEAGKVSITWQDLKKIVATGKVTFTAKGSKPLAVSLTKKGKQILKNAGSSVKLTAKGSFTPPSQPAVTVTKSFTLHH